MTMSSARGPEAVSLRERISASSLSEAEALIRDTLSDLNHSHPLVSRLALQRFVSALRRCSTPTLLALASQLEAPLSRTLLPTQQHLLTEMSQLVVQACAYRLPQASA